MAKNTPSKLVHFPENCSCPLLISRNSAVATVLNRVTVLHLFLVPLGTILTAHKIMNSLNLVPVLQLATANF